MNKERQEMEKTWDQIDQEIKDQEKSRYDNPYAEMDYDYEDDLDSGRSIRNIGI